MFLFDSAEHNERARPERPSGLARGARGLKCAPRRVVQKPTIGADKRLRLRSVAFIIRFNLREHVTTCILHIGGHKTGTTSIQSFLNGYRDDSFFYAEFLKTRGNHSYPLWLLFSSRLRIPFHGHSPLFKKLANQALHAVYRVQFARNLRRAGRRQLILSGEGMTNLDRAELTRLRNRLRKRFSDIRVIGYVRPAAGLIPSLCQQALKFRGDADDIDGVLAGRPNYSYRAEFADFYEVFGEASVDISVFDRNLLREGCVVGDFCGKLGIPVADKRFSVENETLPFELIQLLYIFHSRRSSGGRSGLSAGDFKRLHARLYGIVDPTLRLSFSEEVYRRLFANMADDLAWAETRFDACLSATNPPDDEFGTVSAPDDLRALSDSLFDRLVAIAPGGLRAAGLSNSEANACRILDALFARYHHQY